MSTLKIKSEMTEHADRVIAFIGGAVFSIIGAVHTLDSIEDFALKVFTVFVVGLVGGFAGLLGKRIFVWAENKLK